MASPPISIKLRCASWKQLAAIYERDLTRSAVFLKSAAPPPVGTRVRINLTLPTQTLIVLNGSVERHIGAGELGGRGPGVDIKLNNVPQSAMWLIESALESARREGTMNATAKPARVASSAPATPPIPPSGNGEGAQLGARTGDLEMDSGAPLVEAEDDLIAALSQELLSLRKLNPFQTLGVGYETADDEVRGAFASLTKRYHPDRFARYESSEARRIANEIFILIRDAYQRLENADARGKTIAALDKRRAAKAAAAVAATQARAEATEAAAANAEIPDQSGQADQAEAPDAANGAARQADAASDAARQADAASDAARQADAVETAPAGDPQDNDSEAEDDRAGYVRLFALLDQAKYKEARTLFALAVRRNPGDRTARIGIELAEGLWALSQRDRLEAAQRFELVLELDPQNERAARELAEMRRQATNERRNLLTRLLEKKE